MKIKYMAEYLADSRGKREHELDLPVLIYWLAMYGFCIAALMHLGIAAEKPVYFAAGILFGLGTLALGMIKKENDGREP